MRQMIITVFILFTIVGTNAATKQKQVPIPELAAKHCSVPPVIDGKLDDDAWKNAAETEEYLLFNTPNPPKFKTKSLLTYDDKNLYVAFMCDDPNLKKWFNDPSSAVDFDGSVWMDDCVELYFTDPHNPKQFYQFITNYKNVCFDRYTAQGNKRWNGIWHSAVGSNGVNQWYAEFSIPLYVLNVTPATKQVRLNVCREKYNLPAELSSWSCTYGDYHHFDRFGLVNNIKLSPGELEISDISWPEKINWSTNEVSCTVSNKTAKEWQGDIILSNYISNGYKTLSSKKIHLDAGVACQVDLPFLLAPGQSYKLSIGYKQKGKMSTTWQHYKSLKIPRLLKIIKHQPVTYTGQVPEAICQLASLYDIAKITCTTIDSNGNECSTISAVPKQKNVHLSLPLSMLKPGNYKTIYSVVFKDGNIATKQTRDTIIVSNPWKDKS